jgi:hypothetical protein
MIKELNTCCICLEHTNTFTSRIGVPVKPRTSDDKVLKCKHVFHRRCISTWIQKQHPSERATCPCCRAPIPSRLRVLWVRFIEQLCEFIQGSLDKYIYYDYTYLILFVNDVKQDRVHHCNAAFELI